MNRLDWKAISKELERRKSVYFFAFAFILGFSLNQFGIIGQGVFRSVAIISSMVGLALLSTFVRRQLSRVFFFIRNKLIASYCFIALVPVFLVTLVFAMIGYLTLGQIFAYQAAMSMTELLQDVSEIRSRVAFRIQRITSLESASSLKAEVQEILTEEAEPLREVLPSLVLAVSITDTKSNDHVEAFYSNTETVPRRIDPPSWLQEREFDGFVVMEDQSLAVKSFATLSSQQFDFAIDLNLPVVRSTLEQVKLGVGAELRTIIPVSRGPHGAGGVPVLRTGGSTHDERTGSPAESGSLWEPIPIWGIWVITAQSWFGHEASEETRFLIAETNLGRVVEILRSISIENNILILSFFIGAAALFIGIELVSLTAGVFLARGITSSIGELARGTEQIRRGNIRHKIEVHSKDQLGELALSFNQMTESLDGLLKESREKERMSEELRIGHRIQQSLLPSALDNFAGLEISATNLPAREVGGDYYDVFALNDGLTGVVIADVSGKGISAAFYMAELKGLALALSRTTISPRRFLVDANRILRAHLDRKTFVTMSYAIFNVGKGCMTFARAGHSPVLVQRHQSALVEQILPPGIGLALVDDGGFEKLIEEKQIDINTGDTIVFYTDGVSEAMDSRNNTFSDERIVDLLREHGGESPDRLRQIILGEVNRFTGKGGMLDDRSLIVIKVTATC